MKTEDLIAALARGTETEPRAGWKRRLAITLIAGLAAAAALLVIDLACGPILASR